ncbi:MAG: CRISPR-associated endonuclease Cas2 [Lachnospiraceae bacterium]|nr:CRISPR-associated endonuclease Cas2 [Lachnospiraceae bacterium]
MSGYRFMRMIVFFDLPTLTVEDRRNYRAFRKLLITNGFIMLQESVYCKMMPSPSVEQSMKNLLKRNKPPAGLVQSLTVTEKQFSKMNYIIGKAKMDVIDSEEHIIIL